MENPFLKLLFCSGTALLLNAHAVTAQLTVTGQVRIRSELRDGQGTLPVKDAKPNLFTSQRTRLNLGYNTDRYRFLVSGQEVRVWGSDQSTISNLEGGKLFLHQAWGEIVLSDSTTLKVDNLSVKAGRQEIMYDDARLLGNLDWLQQARRHDAIILKFSHRGWITDAGFAFNQNHGMDGPGKTGNVYNPLPAAPVVPGTNAIGMMYKAMQYGYFARTGSWGKASALVFKDDFQKTSLVDGLLTPVQGVNSRITTGGAIFARAGEHLMLNAAAYYQGNKDRLGNKLRAHNLTADVAIIRGRFTTNPGFDYLSGNNTTRQSSINNRFDPLYGTPHKFWGLMDYFYVADQFGIDGNLNRSPGLVNFFIRNKFKATKKLQVMLDLHEFYTGNQITTQESFRLGPLSSSRRLGTEADLLFHYTHSPSFTAEAGYAVLFATNNLDLLKAPATDKRNWGQWAYLMLNFTPDFLSK